MTTETEPIVVQPAVQPMPATLGEWFSRLGAAAPAALAACVLPLLGLTLLAVYLEPLGLWLRSHWPWGPLIYAGAFVIFGGLGLMPTWTYSALGGWTFGFGVGLPAALAGYVGGALVGYAIGRATAGDRVVGLVESNVKWRAVYDALLRSSTGRTFLIVFLVRLASSPFALTNLIFAATRVPIWIYVLATATGLAARTAVVIWLAAQISGEHFDYKENKVFFVGGIVIGVGVVLVISYFARRALANVVERRPDALDNRVAQAND